MKSDPAIISRMREMALAGHHAGEIAADLGVPAEQVRSLAYHCGIAIRRMTPEERAASGRAAVSSCARYTSVPVPDWVPADLVGEYRDFVRDLGPAYADRAVRKLMADAI